MKNGLDDLACSLKRSLPKSFYRPYVRHQYKRYFGVYPDLDDPKKYSEKIQWVKLYGNTPLKTKLADKLAVRDWIRERIGEEYLVPIVGGPWKSAKEIGFDSLPERYVLKTNHGSGSVIVVDGRKPLDRKEAVKKLDRWLHTNYAFYSFELQYRDIEPFAYAEEYLEDEVLAELPDYKFFCFDGHVYCCYLIFGRRSHDEKSRRGFLDRDFKVLPFQRKGYHPLGEDVERPENYDEMVKLAEKLSEGFSHVRVDLYSVKGKIYFGEMTFTGSSGFWRLEPEDYDRVLGDQWDLHTEQRMPL